MESGKQSGLRSNRGAVAILLFFTQKLSRANKLVIFSLSSRRHLTKSGIKVMYKLIKINIPSYILKYILLDDCISPSRLP